MQISIDKNEGYAKITVRDNGKHIVTFSVSNEISGETLITFPEPPATVLTFHIDEINKQLP